MSGNILSSLGRSAARIVLPSWCVVCQGDFPLSRRYGVVVEGTYHWVNYHYRPRYLTLTGGLRITF